MKLTIELPDTFDIDKVKSDIGFLLSTDFVVSSSDTITLLETLMEADYACSE